MARTTRSCTRQQEHEESQENMKVPVAKVVLASKTAATVAKKRPAPTLKALSAATVSTPSVKKQKVAKANLTAPGATAARPTTHASPGGFLTTKEYSPTLLPPTLVFDFSAAQHHLSTHDARFHTYFKHIPCKPFSPPIQAIDPFRTLVTSIIGQQVSWMAARAINQRFRALFGYIDAPTDGDGKGDKEADEDMKGGFPSPAQVLSEDIMTLKSCGLSLRKAEYVKSLAENFSDGRLSAELLRDGSDEEIGKALIAVRGIGQWTVDMFLMFSLHRPDILPVGDLGVQKGLLRWALAAHGALPKVKGGKSAEEARKKYGLGPRDSVVEDKVRRDVSGEIDTVVVDRSIKASTPPQKPTEVLPPTPLTPSTCYSSAQDAKATVTPGAHTAALHTPGANGIKTPILPPTPVTPGPNTKPFEPEEAFIAPAESLPLPAPDGLIFPPSHVTSWDPHAVTPLPEGLSVETMKSRLNGKKAKGGAYLTPSEMETLTAGWRPYRSLGVYYMWPAGEDM